ncbi:MAG: MBL fold metallo-hydrolase [Oscillospiraceae bacterium]|nr:MBL fold metallo-hydrolase [Oscillospiraceae bacterium]MCL2248346.1 MBL fold metallo-hydrolase [Oscillospiraceae bacterium]
MKIYFHGCRGSIAISRPGSRYGGNTSCITLESGGELLVIDAGTGIMDLHEKLLSDDANYIANLRNPINILVSHLHIDHIIGIATFPPLCEKNGGVRIYTGSRSEKPLKEQVLGAFSPPHWPVSLCDVGNAECVQIEDNVPFKVGVYTVTPFLANHPDITYSFHVTDGKKSVVHLLDSEISKVDAAESKVLHSHCKDADVVVFDAAYSPEDYHSHYEGWGHSTVPNGIELADEWKCRCMVFSHMFHKYNDEELDEWKKYFAGDPRFMLAHDGLELEI